MIRLLSKAEIQQKCKIGQGARCCIFLVAGAEGLQCGWLDAGLRASLEARRRKSTAKSGPCVDPYDETSEAVPYCNECGGDWTTCPHKTGFRSAPPT